MEESFPRGGGGGGGRLDSASAALRTPSAKEQKSSSTSTSTKRKAQQQAQAGADKDDFLFGSRSTATPGEGGASGKKKRRKSSAHGDPSGSGSSSMLPLGGGAVLQPTAFDSSNRGKDGGPSKAALIESLSFNKLGKGTRLLGLVRDVAPDYAVVSLPNMLTGFVRRSKATDIALTDVYTPGTMMAFSIVKTTTETVASSSSSNSSSANGKAKTETRRRIELTASPQVINADLRLADLDDGDAATTIRGKIVSCEDHGCIVDLGLAGLGRKMAFLRYENVEGGYDIAAYEEDEEMKDSESESGSDDEEGDEKMEGAEDSDDDDDDENNGGRKGKKKKGGNDQKSNGAAKFILNAGRIYDFTVKSIPTALLSSSTAAAGAGGAAVVQLGLRKASSLARVVTSIIATSASSSSSTGYTVRTLRPGMLLKCHVEHYARNGLCVTFLGNVFRGSIDMANLGGYWSGVGKMDGVKDANLWWKDVFVGKLKTVSARLIAVDPATKIIRLSLLPHVLALSAPLTEERQNASAAPLPSVGSIIENARVIRHDPGVGALIALPLDSDGDDDMDIDGDGGNSKLFGGSAVAKLLSNDTYRAAAAVKCAYVHISKAMDPPTKEKGRNYRTPEALFAKHFALHAKVPRLRILSTSNLMDNVASCATAESIVASAALSYSDLTPGAKYTSVPIIRSMDGGGILVELGHGIRGLVPANHLFDKAQSSGKDGSSYRSKVRAEKFRVGNKIDVRCLKVDEDARRCVLTAKKTLVQSDPVDPITDYFSIEAGKIATGFISKVDRTGVTVTFYNNVYGKATARRLAEELGVEDPTTNYNVGDVIRARVVSCRRYKLDLSLNTSISDDDGEKSPSKTGTKLEPGSILQPKCMKIVQLFDSRPRDDGVSFIPGYAVVTIKAKHLNIEDEGQSVDCKISFDQILDAYDTDATASAEGLDKMARRVLKVGKKINQPAIVIFSGKDGTSGKVAMPVVSLRPALVKTAKLIAESEEGTTKVSLPSPETSLYQGAIVQGYCTRLDPRYGAFIRFLNGLTGLIPKLKGGLDVNLFDTVLCRISALDVTSGSRPKILLKKLRSIEGADSGKSKSSGKEVDIKVDEIVGDVRVEDVNFARATVTLTGDKYKGAKIRARIHFTMAVQPSTPRMPLEHPVDDDDAGSDGHTDASKTMITTHHPFYKWSSGDILNDVKCVAVENRNGTLHIELAVIDDLSSKAKKSSKKSKNKGASAGENNPTPVYVSEASHLPAGTAISGVITRVCSQNRGVWIHVCPGTTGFVSGMELSDDIDVLNNLKQYYKVGGVLNCTVMEKRGINSDKKKQQEGEKAEQVIFASAMQFEGIRNQSGKPTAGDLVIGRVNRSIKPQHAPALMLELRGGFEARCDITELNEMDEWENMPLGRLGASVIGSANNTPHKEKNSQGAIVTDESADDNDSYDDDSIMSEDEEDAVAGGSDYPTGKYVRCRVLPGFKSAAAIEVSLRESRLDGDLEDDEAPEPKEMVHAYVITTNKKGCFVRLSRFVEGRVILKELADGFLPDPAAMFPQGRLVIGKVKDIRHQPSDAKKGKKYTAKVMVDLDMRESTLLEDEDKITYDDIKVGEKYKGTVTRVEPYGVFVRLENSEMTGLAHLSECSDNYIKNLTDLYDPGDLVKALVVKKDEEQHRFGLSLKASHFEDDSDSDDDQSTSSSESGSDADGADDVLNDVLVSEAEDSDDDLDSDDENFASKLASKIKGGNNEEDDDDKEEEEENSSDEDSSSSDDDDDGSDDDDEEDDSSSSDDEDVVPTAMDTDVGFNWGSKDSSADATAKGANGNESSDSDSSDESDDDDNDEIGNAGKSSHKARKKAAARRKEEKEISARESALADGTADSNPETSADFERLLAADPNASENWIRYMAYHLSLADIDSARNVANRAFDRIEFRQEDEKLNVWTALLTLEFKYGTPKSQQATIDRASQHNNPKKVYLRVCEMLEREVDASTSSSDRAQTQEAAVARADELFLKMCKKFKSKKTVWIAHLKYLLKSARHEEAHALLKRAMQSLPDYKHVETMSKFAQLEFEHGSPERARTIYDTLIEKHPKRLDLLFVYVDKEVKHGELAAARNIFMNVINPTDDGKKKAKYSDKQMKSLFKKWFRIEEEHGDVDSREEVKAAARDFVERTAASK